MRNLALVWVLAGVVWLAVGGGISGVYGMQPKRTPDDELSFDAGLLTFSYSYEAFKGKSGFNYSVGQELVSSQHIVSGSGVDFWVYHYPSLNYKWGESGRALGFQWIFSPFTPVEYDWSEWFSLGAGPALSYNISNKYFGVGPQFDILVGTDYPFKLNVTYRYKVNFGAENSHEVELKIAVIDYLNW
jgi:hypothetical protein